MLEKLEKINTSYWQARYSSSYENLLHKENNEKEILINKSCTVIAEIKPCVLSLGNTVKQIQSTKALCIVTTKTIVFAKHNEKPCNTIIFLTSKIEGIVKLLSFSNSFRNAKNKVCTTAFHGKSSASLKNLNMEAGNAISTLLKILFSHR